MQPCEKRFLPSKYLFLLLARPLHHTPNTPGLRQLLAIIAAMIAGPVCCRQRSLCIPCLQPLCQHHCINRACKTHAGLTACDRHGACHASGLTAHGCSASTCPTLSVGYEGTRWLMVWTKDATSSPRQCSAGWPCLQCTTPLVMPEEPVVPY
jgi:hypothetical protein